MIPKINSTAVITMAPERHFIIRGAFLNSCAIKNKSISMIPPAKNIL
jgi:hypothetical protein